MKFMTMSTSLLLRDVTFWGPLAAIGHTCSSDPKPPKRSEEAEEDDEGMAEWLGHEPSGGGGDGGGDLPIPDKL